MNSRLDCFKAPEGQSCYFATYDSALKLWPIPYEEIYITTSYGQTHLISCGAKDASPLILLRGYSRRWLGSSLCFLRSYWLHSSCTTPPKEAKALLVDLARLDSDLMVALNRK